MKKKVIFGVFSIGLICLSSVGAIERTYNSDVNDVTYQETSSDVNSNSSYEQTTQSTSYEAPNTFALSVIDFTTSNITSTSATLNWNLDIGDAQSIDKIEISDTANGIPITDTGSVLASDSYTLTGLTPNTMYDITLTVSWTNVIGIPETTTSNTSFTTLNVVPLSVIDFTASDVTETSAILNWNLDMGDASSIDKIEISDTANGIPLTDTGSILATDSYTLTGLTPSTLYNVTLTVTWTDALGAQQTTTDVVSFTTLDAVPLSVIDFTAIDITKTEATLNWNLDMGEAQSIDKIELSYTDPTNGPQIVDTGSVLTSDSYTLTGLTPGTLYDVTLIVTWTDVVGIQQTTTDVESFTTLEQTSLSITQFTTTNVSKNSATLNWDLDIGDAQSIDSIELTYTDPVNGNQLVDTGSILATDSYTLTNLAPSSTYDVTLIVSWTDYYGVGKTTTDVVNFSTSDQAPLTITEFTATNVMNTSATLNWTLNMGDAQSIDQIRLSYTDANGSKTIDTGLTSLTGSYEINGLIPDSLYDVTLIVTWTDALGVQQATSDIVSFTTTYTELEIVSTNIETSSNQAIVSWEIEPNDSTIENIAITDSVGTILADGSTDAVGSYTIDSSNEDNYDWNIIVTYSSPSGTQHVTDQAITNVDSNGNDDFPVGGVVGGIFGSLFLIALIALIVYLVLRYRKNIKSPSTNEESIDAESVETYDDASEMFESEE